MKIGQLVQAHIHAIFDYCDKNPDELKSLMSKNYSKKMFDINFSFCTLDPPLENHRFWSKTYNVCGERVRVTNDWYKRNKTSFLEYLYEKGIPYNGNETCPSVEGGRGQVRARDYGPTVYRSRQGRGRKGNSRYALGNAQNAFIRNILSRLGDASFSDDEWEEVKEFFDKSCAYCGEAGKKLVMEHAIPINREYLGEHQLGNLVPSCSSCNSAKAGKDYKEFIKEDSERLEKINEHMSKSKYVPLREMENFECLREVCDIAYKELSPLADRYVQILNLLIEKK